MSKEVRDDRCSYRWWKLHRDDQHVRALNELAAQRATMILSIRPLMFEARQPEPPEPVNTDAELRSVTDAMRQTIDLDVNGSPVSTQFLLKRCAARFPAGDVAIRSALHQCAKENRISKTENRSMWSKAQMKGTRHD